MIYKNKNYSRGSIKNINPENGDTFEGCNFAQTKPHTKIFEGVTGLIFIKCNGRNCDPDKGSVIIKGVWTHKTLCSHRHIKLLELGEITKCKTECEHVQTDPDEIIIDGVSLGKNYVYKDLVVE